MAQCCGMGRRAADAAASWAAARQPPRQAGDLPGTGPEATRLEPPGFSAHVGEPISAADQASSREHRRLPRSQPPLAQEAGLPRRQPALGQQNPRTRRPACAGAGTDPRPLARSFASPSGGKVGACRPAGTERDRPRFRFGPRLRECSVYGSASHQTTYWSTRRTRTAWPGSSPRSWPRSSPSTARSSRSTTCAARSPRCPRASASATPATRSASAGRTAPSWSCWRGSRRGRDRHARRERPARRGPAHRPASASAPRTSLSRATGKFSTSAPVRTERILARASVAITVGSTRPVLPTRRERASSRS